jgi:hypothetical protein
VLSRLTAVIALALALAVGATHAALADTGDYQNTAYLSIAAKNPSCACTPPTTASLYPATISVSGLAGTVAKATVTLHGITHEDLYDLAVLLAGPGGQSVVLMATFNAGNVSNQTGAFDDAGVVLNQSNCFQGTFFQMIGPYHPFNCALFDPFPSPAPAEPYGSALAVFNGMNPNGTWSLYAMNDYSGGSGHIASGWSLHIETKTTPPANTGAPTISGTAQLGQTLSCSTGSWTGNPAPSFSYQWLRDGSAIGGAAGSTYAVQAADQGHTLACEVIASNSAGKQAATSLEVTIPAATSGGGPSGTESSGGGLSGVASFVAAGAGAVSTGEVAALLTSQLTPSGKAARIGTLLKGATAIMFRALEAGTATVAWYYLPPGAKIAKHAKPVLVAFGRLTFAAPETAMIRIKPTTPGKSLLKRASRIKLTAKGTFTPTGMTPITVTRTFLLKR